MLQRPPRSTRTDTLFPYTSLFRSIVARLFDAGALTIWTDVDGVLSADPRLVPEAVCLPSMSYAEACELAYFGAKVLHPQTLSPLQSQGIPLRIRNTRRPQAAGTWIGNGPGSDSGNVPVKGLSLVDNLALLELSGNGMVGVPGTAERLFARSEEHTSELQSLMRISYAVFCLKKTTTKPYTISETLTIIIRAHR